MVLVWHKDNCIMWLGFLVRKCRSAVLCFFACLAVCSCLTFPECYWRAAQIFFKPVLPRQSLQRFRKSVGGNKALECESHIWLFGFWTISWDWKFMQLSAGLNTPSSSEKDLLHCSLGKAYVPRPPPLTSTTDTAITNTEVYETPLIKGRSHCSVEYDILWNGVSGWSNFLLLFYSPSAAYGFPVNLCVGPRSVLHLMHSLRSRIEICTWLTI